MRGWLRIMEDVDGRWRSPVLQHIGASVSNRLSRLSGVSVAPCSGKSEARWCHLQGVSGRMACPQLYFVCVSYNPGLRSLLGIAGVPRLRIVHVQRCDVESSARLKTCPTLEATLTSEPSFFFFSPAAFSRAHSSRIREIVER